MNGASKWILGPPPAATANVRLFCFSYAGAGAAALMPWRPLFASRGVEALLVQLPGRETRFNEAPCTSMKPLVGDICDALAPHLDRPFSLFGHSMGAVIAYEVARELQCRAGSRTRPVPLWLIASGSVAPHRRPPESLHTLPREEFIATVATRFNGIPAEVLAHEELLEIVAPVLHADFALMELYRHGPGPLLTANIAVLGGDDDPSVATAELDGWRELTSGAFESRVFGGDHFFIHQHRAAIVDFIAQKLRH